MPALQTSALLPLAQLRAGNNHRKFFDEEKLAELTASMKKHGVLQPILVRPLAKPSGKVTHETVAGERRYRAAKAAGLKEIPVVIRELSDKEALEVGLVENLRREDVLPMEEAEGYRELHVVHKESVEQLAERVGKSKEYVYGRLKLCELKSPAVRKALDSGKVSPSTALLIARVPGEKLQESLAKQILEGGAWDDETQKPGPMSYRHAQRLVEGHYMLLLGKAPFNTKDEKLVPEAGACGPCPKRTGNCKELYSDVKSDNVCTDTECFGKKKAAAFKQEAEAAKAKGQKLLKDSPALWDYTGKELNHKGQEKYFELSDKCPGDKKGRTFKQLLGADVKVVVARDTHGTVHQLVAKEGLDDQLASAGHKLKVKEKKPGGGGEDYVKQRRLEQFRGRVARRLLDAGFGRIATAAVDEMKVLRFLVRQMQEWNDHDLALAWKERAEGNFPALVTDAKRLELLAYLAEGLLSEPLNRTWNGYAPETAGVCELFGLELAALEKEQEAEDKAAPPAAEQKVAKAPEEAGEEQLDADEEEEPE